MEEFKELEFKYNANEVNLSDFIALVEQLKPSLRKDVSSWDFYYTKEAGVTEEFLRFRDASEPELTIKRKVKDANNWERIEVDLPLDHNRVTKSKVDNFAKLLTYSENFRIYKSCFIFWFDNLNIVYYIVYDANMKEKGRFLEIEVNKEKVAVLGLDKAFQELKELEQKLSALNITPQNRMKRSLFELFVK